MFIQSIKSLLILTLFLQPGLTYACPFPSAKSLYYSKELHQKKIKEAKTQQSQEQVKFNSLAQQLSATNTVVAQLTKDVKFYKSHLNLIQNEINRVFNNATLITELSEECAECLTLEDLFDYIKDDLSDEVWATLKPLRDYLKEQDKLQEAENKRLKKAIETQNPEQLIEGLEEDLAGATAESDSKQQALTAKTQDQSQLQAGYNQTKQNLEGLKSSIVSWEKSLREVEMQLNTGQFKESQCSKDGSIIR